MLNLVSFDLSPLGAFGQLALLAALAFTLGGLSLAVLGGARRDERLTESAGRATWAVLGFSTLALFALWTALVRDDFSVKFVADHSMSVSPLWVKIVSLWGALEGSILLWAWMLAVFAFLVALLAKKDALRPWVFASMFVSLLFFLGVNATIASPFTPVASAPPQGAGPNPLLQNHWMMAVHPVLMYIGFVGLAVPFAYGVAALVTGRTGNTWLVQTRRWTLVAWTFLTAAIVAGGWWSYEVLGWGGYWAWDPVENASFIPWLLATAFLHSLQVQERRRILVRWNVWLIVAAYAATILGTFLNRAGIVQSVHAFGGGPVGPVFLGFFAFLILAGLVLATWRSPLLRDEHSIDQPVSREGAYLAGNVVFLAFAVMVVVGTLFPAFVEALQGSRISVGPPFFNVFAIPLGLLILLLMGVGPLLPWRRAPGEKLVSALRVPGAMFLAAVVIGLLVGAREIGVLLTCGLAAYNLAGLGQLTARAARQRRAGLPTLVREQPRRYGAYLAHVGIVIVSLGLAFSGTYRAETTVTLEQNQERRVLRERLQFLGVGQERLPERTSVYARVLVDGAEYRPRNNLYVTSRDPVATPAVRYALFGDTYLVLTAFDPAGKWANVRLIESPLVSWIWWGTVVIVVGAGLTLAAPATVRSRASSARVAPATD